MNQKYKVVKTTIDTLSKAVITSDLEKEFLEISKLLEICFNKGAEIHLSIEKAKLKFAQVIIRQDGMDITYTISEVKNAN